jgi:predicted dehydrogenase
MVTSVNNSPSILVCGAGSIGQRHINNLQSLNVKVSAWRSRKELAEELSVKFGITVYTDLNRGLEQVDAVVIATTTNTHVEIALKAAEQGKAIFIEKPLAKSFAEIAPLVDIISKNSNIVEIGFQLRTHPNLIKIHELSERQQLGQLYTYRAVVGQRLDKWRPDTDYRKSYSVSAKQGGGALLDLIHEIDLINWLTGGIKKVYGRISHVSDLEMSADDLVNLTLINKNGAVGQLQMDMVSPEYRRSLELVYRDAIIYWDYTNGTVYKRANGVELLIDKTPKEFEKNTMFINQMSNFIKRVKGGGERSFCTLEDAIAAQIIAESARISSEEERIVNLEEVD